MKEINNIVYYSIVYYSIAHDNNDIDEYIIHIPRRMMYNRNR